MRASDCRTDLLRQLAQTPFADRLELAALSGWSPSAVYQQMNQLEQCGCVEHVTHATSLIPSTRRYCLTARGTEALSRATDTAIGQLLRQNPVSEQWRRLLIQRLDAAAALYRLAAAISGSQHTLRFRWYRAQPMDAIIELPDRRSVSLVRIGRTTDRTALAKRLRRLEETLGLGAALVILPDQVRLRHARRILAGSTLMAFLAVEQDAVKVVPDAPIWRITSGNARFSMAEALGYALPARDAVIERPLARVSPPRPLDDAGLASLSATEQRALDYIGDWPWLRPAQLAELLDCGQRRTSRILSWLEKSQLVASRHVHGKPRVVLSDAGIAQIARRDRTAVAIAKQRWSTESREPVESGQPLIWRNISGARSRQLLRHLEHTESVHWLIAQVAKQAAEADVSIPQLDPPQRASRYFRYEGGVRSVHPDAFFCLDTSSGGQAFFLEYERRADRPSTMRDRLAPYLRYYSTRRPLEDHGVIPTVLVVFEGELSAHHFVRHAQQEMRRWGQSLPLLVSDRRELERSGPLGAAWRSPSQQSNTALLEAG